MSDTMDKLPITDPTIRIVPSKDLRKFIGNNISMSPSAPASVREIYCTYNVGKKGKTSINKKGSPDDGKQKHVTVDFTADERNLISHMVAGMKDQQGELNSMAFVGPEQDNSQNTSTDATQLNLSDIKWLYATLKELRQTDPTVPYLHTLLNGCQLKLPVNPIQERNPELEARCQRLRKEHEDREYYRMTKNVDSIRKHMPEETISYQMKQINRHLIAVAQFLFSVAAGFAFGFIGIELLIGQLDFGFRLLLGIIIALIIALAEIYFLAKKLNEEYDLPPPPAFTSKEKPPSTVQKAVPASKSTNKNTSTKEHDE
ncbi:transmembrane protein 199 [Anopheles marshallii]|uniref:transmembrane protein 199 n=1 Tax=Anopheles marshallii TaxID=1521116 RepID=UPI00237ABA8D|nr:transmembrane protein 199 [Anopheles marshallii]